MVDFTGNHEEPEWIETELYSVDCALRWDWRSLGWPTRTLTQMYGPTSVGKSTVINSIACIMARKLELGVACLDLEHQSSKTIQAIADSVGFSGEWKWIEPKKGKTSDDFTDEALLTILKKEILNGYITILDSVAMISPVAEEKGNVGDRNVGARAYPMAQYVRGVGRRLKWAEKPTIAFMANHKYEKIATGLAFSTYHAPGGSVKDNINFINIDANFAYHEKKKLHYGDGWVLEGKVNKKIVLEYPVTAFWVFVVGGRGIHFGLTAMFDCIKFGLAKIGSGNVLYLKDTGEEVSRVSDIVRKRDGFDFAQFENLLKAHQITQEDDAALHEKEDVEYVQDDEDKE